MSWNKVCCINVCARVQAQQQAELAKQAEAAARAAEEERAKAQQEASAALARAQEEAAATLQEAQAKAARISQEQEDRTKLAAEGAKQQVWYLVSWRLLCLFPNITGDAHLAGHSSLFSIHCIKRI